MRLREYGSALDLKHRDVWIDLWADDAVLVWPGGRFQGRLDIMRAFDQHSRIPGGHRHFALDTSVELRGLCASADSTFIRVDFTKTGPVLRSIGTYHDELIRMPDGVWRFTARTATLESRIPIEAADFAGSPRGAANRPGTQPA